MPDDEVDALANELLAQREMFVQRCINLTLENTRLKRELAKLREPEKPAPPA